MLQVAWRVIPYNPREFHEVRVLLYDRHGHQFSEQRSYLGFDRPFVVIGERINPTGRKIPAAEMVAGIIPVLRRTR